MNCRRFFIFIHFLAFFEQNTRFWKMKSRREQLEAMLAHGEVRRSSELRAAGFTGAYLRYAFEHGWISRPGRGLYAAPDTENISEQHTLALVAKRCPQAVICLFSALRFHGVGVQNPSEIWVAVSARAWKPSVDFVRLRVVRFSKDAMTAGVEKHKVDGVPVKITSPARTVVDLFRYRNKTGVEPAVEALRETVRSRLATPAEISRLAKTARVARVMRPYLESLS